MELLGQEIKLRPVGDSDIDTLYEWWNDPGFSGDFSADYPINRDQVQDLVNEGSFFIISSRSDNRKIGFIACYMVRKDYLNLFEIGYRVKPDERRKGYTTEAARLLVDYLFESKKEIERIESVTDIDNIPSQRVLEKVGFTREAELRKRFYNRGNYRTELMYRLLREEWIGRVQESVQPKSLQNDQSS